MKTYHFARSALNIHVNITNKYLLSTCNEHNVRGDSVQGIVLILEGFSDEVERRDVNINTPGPVHGDVGQL